MKKKYLLLSATVGLVVTMILSSCTMTKNNEFSKQKYTNFRKGESTVNIIKPVKEKKNIYLYTAMAEKKDVSETSIVATDKPSQTNPTTVQTVKTETGNNTLAQNTSVPKEKIKVRINRVAASFMNKLAKEGSTTSVKDGSVNLLILVILSILLPPLAVFLARGLNTPFWIDLILTLLFWIPGVIYALLIVCNAI